MPPRVQEDWKDKDNQYLKVLKYIAQVDDERIKVVPKKVGILHVFVDTNSAISLVLRGAG